MSEPQAQRFWLQGRYADLAAGRLSVEDLDDEEISRGQLRAVDGTFRGRPPKFLPADLVNAMKREWLSRAQARLREALYEGGIDVLVTLATDPEMDPSIRERAASKIIERTMGKVPEKIELSAEDPVERLFRDILADPRGLDPNAPRELSAAERELLS